MEHLRALAAQVERTMELRRLSLHIWLLERGLRGFWRVLLAGTVSVYRCEWLSVIECKLQLLCCTHPGKSRKRECCAFIRPPTLRFRAQAFQVYWVPKQPLKRVLHLSGCPSPAYMNSFDCFLSLWFHLWSIDLSFLVNMSYSSWAPGLILSLKL